MRKYAVVTGASSGIGRETARLLAGRGYDLILTARREDRLRELQDELSNGEETKVRVHRADLSKEGEARRFFEIAAESAPVLWINNAGAGDYHFVGENQDRERTMIRLNVESVCVLSSLFVRDFGNIPDAQLVNVSSCGGYVLVPNATVYCATKFFVSAFTEGLARELQARGLPLRAKVFAPAATSTEFGMRANDVDAYDYDRAFARYETASAAAQRLLRLIDAPDAKTGLVDRETFDYTLSRGIFPYAGNSAQNQNMR